jgi:single-stranded DNA-binding protein
MSRRLPTEAANKMQRTQMTERGSTINALRASIGRQKPRSIRTYRKEVLNCYIFEKLAEVAA